MEKTRAQDYLVVIHREKYSLCLKFLPFPAITSQKTLQGCHTYSHTALRDYSLLSKARNLRKSTTFYAEELHTTPQQPLSRDDNSQNTRQVIQQGGRAAGN